MTAFTDAIVLEAPVFWWPAVGDVPTYPLDPVRSFLAAVTDAPMPWPRHALSHNAVFISTTGLSRLGSSVCLTAQWSALEDSHAAPFVQVWNPFSGAPLFFPVSTFAGLGASVAGRQEKDMTTLDLVRLVLENRLRFTHRRVSAASSLPRLQAQMQRHARQEPSYDLLHRVVHDVHAAALRYLERVSAANAATVAGSAASSFSVSPSTSPSVAAGSFLFTDDTPSQRHLLHLLHASTPLLLPIRDSHVVALEVRRLHFAEVLTLGEHEALEAVEAALRPPLPSAVPVRRTEAALSLSSAPASTAPLLPCLLILLEGLHLLEKNANALVASVTHQLCASLDALREPDRRTATPALIWSFTEDMHAMPLPLLVRVGAQHCQVSTTAAEDRMTYLRKRLERVKGAIAPNVALTDVATALVEETAHWTVDRLLTVGDTELWKLCAAHTPTQSSGVVSSPPLPAQGTMDAASEPLHAVYDHLYGIDDEIRKVEELVVWPLTHLPLLQGLSIPCAKGVLLCGPSGAGKTALLFSLVRRLQQPDTRHIHVLSVDGLSLLEKEVGRSEKNIAQLFETARALAPTALFIDNFDSLAPPRGRITAESNPTSDRTLSTLLTQMDGVSGGGGGGRTERIVVVVASAPSLTTLDPAVYRPGRLDVHVHLAVPPMQASAAFMRQRLWAFVQRVQQRFGSSCTGVEAESRGGRTADGLDVVRKFVEAEVDRYFSGLAAAIPRHNDEEEDDYDDEAEASRHAEVVLSPAEVLAAVREVMLGVVERLSRKAPAAAAAVAGGSEAETTASPPELLDCLRDAFARLGSL